MGRHAGWPSMWGVGSGWSGSVSLEALPSSFSKAPTRRLWVAITRARTSPAVTTPGCEISNLAVNAASHTKAVANKERDEDHRHHAPPTQPRSQALRSLSRALEQLRSRTDPGQSLRCEPGRGGGCAMTAPLIELNAEAVQLLVIGNKTDAPKRLGLPDL
jgi:hypothetical protein